MTPARSTFKTAALTATRSIAIKRKTKEPVESDSDDEYSDSGSNNMTVQQPPIKKAKGNDDRLKAKLWAKNEERKKQERLAAMANRTAAIKPVAYDPLLDKERIAILSKNETAKPAAAASRQSTATTVKKKHGGKSTPSIASTARPSKTTDNTVARPPPAGRALKTVAYSASPARRAPMSKAHHEFPTTQTKTRLAKQPLQLPRKLSPDDGLDSGYETGNSVEEVRMARLAKKRQLQGEPFRRYAANGRQYLGTLVAHGLGMLKVVAAATGALLLLMLLLGLLSSFVNVTPTIPSAPTTFAICFSGTNHGATVWPERCADAAFADKLLPCPVGGICDGGDLIACGVDDSMASALIPMPDGMSCGLTPYAASTFLAIINRVRDLSVASMCFERTSIKARNFKPSASSSVMFPYYDLMQEMELIVVDEYDKEQMCIETLTWINFALDKKLVSGLTLEQKRDGPVWIGLSRELFEALPLPSNCVAKRAIISTLDSTKSMVWESMIKGGASLLWTVFCVHPWQCLVLTLMLRRLCIYWYKRQRKNEIKRALALVLTYLMAYPNKMHKVGAICADVKNQMYPGDHVAQARFVKGTWTAVERRVDKDERVLAVTRIVDGQHYDIWQWQGSSS